MNDPNENGTGYDSARHHRRSIRLKSHDYAGGGVYFVTVCAHRDAGDIFAAPAVREMVGNVWANLPESAVGASLVCAPHPMDAQGTHEGCPYVVMPDHFHGILRMRAEEKALGDVVGAFKSLVVHEYIAGVKAGRFAPFPGKIWHRNYYETIVRTSEAETRIAEYIRMNPWKLVQQATHEGQSFSMIGNPTLLSREKIAVLCSRNCPPEVLRRAEAHARRADFSHCFIGGFHAPPEQALLAALLPGEARLICCPAWGIDAMRIPSDWHPALEANRMLILEMRNRDGNLAAAEQRNCFVLECAEKRWIPHIAPGCMLDRVVKATTAPSSSARSTSAPSRSVRATRMSPPKAYPMKQSTHAPAAQPSQTARAPTPPARSVRRGPR